MHYALLADAMTVSGKVLSVNRSGLRKSGTSGVLGHACFETVVQTDTEAGRVCRMDNMSSASSRLAMGMTPTSGTGGFDVITEAPRYTGPRSDIADFLSEPPRKRSKFSSFM